MSQCIYAIHIRKDDINDILNRLSSDDMGHQEKEFLLDSVEGIGGYYDWEIFGASHAFDSKNWVECIGNLLSDEIRENLMGVYMGITPMYFEKSNKENDVNLRLLNLDGFILERSEIVCIMENIEFILREDNLKAIEFKHKSSGCKKILEWRSFIYDMRNILDFFLECDVNDVAVFYMI